MAEPNENNRVVQESGTRTYLHLAAYGFPACFVVIFCHLILIGYLESLYEIVGESSKTSHWVMALCRSFATNYSWILGGLTVLFLVLEKTWAGWSRIRSRVVRLATWCITISVLLGMTWMAVTALLFSNAAIAKVRKDVGLGRPVPAEGG